MIFASVLFRAQSLAYRGVDRERLKPVRINRSRRGHLVQFGQFVCRELKVCCAKIVVELRDLAGAQKNRTDVRLRQKPCKGNLCDGRPMVRGDRTHLLDQVVASFFIDWKNMETGQTALAAGGILAGIAAGEKSAGKR